MITPLLKSIGNIPIDIYDGENITFLLGLHRSQENRETKLQSVVMNNQNLKVTLYPKYIHRHHDILFKIPKPIC